MTFVEALKRHRGMSRLWMLALTLAWPSVGLARVIEVPAEYPSIQEAVDSAAGGDTVLVAPGAYSHSWSRTLTKPTGGIRIITNVMIEAPIVLISVAGAPSTIILGSGLGPAVVVSSARGVVIEGFTIKGGAVDETVLDSGGGIYCELSDLEVRGCVIENNRAPFGAGIACATASGSWIHDNIIRNNGDCEFGGGLALLVGSSGIIESNLFVNNTAEIFGGAIMVNEQSLATVESNTFVGNHATSGSGIFCRDGSEANASLNIFAFCTGGAAVFCDTLAQGRPCLMSLHCNDFWDNAAEDMRGCAPGADNRNENPLFCSPGTDDFTLCAFSPSLGTGDACGRRGALPSGCHRCQVEESRLSWGALKALYEKNSSKSK